jgi:hypothetical protein
MVMSLVEKLMDSKRVLKLDSVTERLKVVWLLVIELEMTMALPMVLLLGRAMSKTQ